MKRQYDVLIQQGHVARTRGATGTAGHRGSEQEFVKLLGPKIVIRLEAHDLNVKLIGADDPRPTAEVFLALHQDGSTNKGVHGASTGFPIHGDGETLVKIWKAQYTKIGWSFGFRRSNYTVGEHYYYAFGGLRRWWWRKAKFDAAFLIEHGFATTVSEEDWMWDHIDKIADADADTILQYFRRLPATEATMTLKQGSTGSTVKDLQKLLNMFSQAGLTIDGDYGPATKAAVIGYQTKLHLSPADGIWGPATVAAHVKFLRYLSAQTPLETIRSPLPAPNVMVVTTPPTPTVTVEQLQALAARSRSLTADIESLIAGLN